MQTSSLQHEQALIQQQKEQIRLQQVKLQQYPQSQQPASTSSVESSVATEQKPKWFDEAVAKYGEFRKQTSL